jgi:ribose-phosphate pyrophosphokinase
MLIRDVHADQSISPRTLTFPGGEPHATIRPDFVRGNHVWIDSRVRNMDDFGHLLAAANAAKRCGPKSLGLFLPYFPGARQDNPEPGTPLTARIFADIINAAGFDAVMIFDPHSPVVTALIDRVHVVPISSATAHLPDIDRAYSHLVCPDAGAEKRVSQVARVRFPSLPIIHCRKTRNPDTGELSGFACEAPEWTAALLVDDICDGGGTFVGLADAMGSPANLDLYVSHGIFSKGVDILAKRFRRIFTTDSFCNVEHPSLTVIPLLPIVTNTMRRLLA